MKININVIYQSIIAFMVVFLPSLLMIFAHQSSFTIGIVISSLVIILCRLILNKKRIVLKNSDVKLFVLLFVSFLIIILHFTLITLFYSVDLAPPDYFKFFLSFIFGIICACAAYILKNAIDDAFDFDIHSTIVFVMSIIMLNGMISLSKIDFFNTGLEKPTFLFQEPSHFALACAPFLIYFSFINIRNRLRLSLLLAFGLWGVYIQNFTMIFAVLLAYIITAKNLLPAFIIFCISGIPVYIFIESDFFVYYRERLDLSGDTSNLSALVLMQGWENAFLTLRQSILGAGFQQYGISTAYGDISNKIFGMINIYINQFDGGATAPKIIGEFGVLGILIVILYVIGWCKIFIAARRNRFTADRKLLLFYSLYLASLLEFFIRGAGYFTPGMFFLIVSVLYFISNKIPRKEIYYETNR
ncbi:hypothetical protein RM352_000443 [Enterobacter kobei]|uniref:hypothetical protein n=1 Tax=Enterobacter kobei TaxID=208224 RepID=UPI00079C10A7|nr:hypothetical protein [Enterobacter kobei]ELE9244108.1 hypothetical protein [Enterobacter kobei]SAG52147.1 Uncharacterised protein [Enterobacter kobei]